MNKHVVIIGAGPGGLSAALQLAHKGYQVDVYEKCNQIGGRNAALTLGDYTFDTGPTFFMMPFVLEEIFSSTGKTLSDYLTLKEVDPMYRLAFEGKPDFYPTRDYATMLEHIENIFPGDAKGYEAFMQDQERGFPHIFNLLKQAYPTLSSMFSIDMLKAIPDLHLGKSVHGVMSKYFTHEEMRLSMTFQAKYLGMSPWKCPGTFSILPYIEHKWGVWHPIGGLNQISYALAKAAEEEGAKIHLQSEVESITSNQGKATGITLLTGEHIEADIVIINADFPYAANSLLQNGASKKWNKKTLQNKQYSCSTFMLYLGLDTQYAIPHHNIYFAKDYKSNVEQITKHQNLDDDYSFYVQNPYKLDATLAPDGHSTLYVLVPTANLDASTDWNTATAAFTENLLTKLETRVGLSDIRRHIVKQHCITPTDWQQDYNVHKGAVFSLAHNLTQMLSFRPRNKFNELEHCYLVGSGTHPGSGLPTILESGTITTKLIEKFEK